MTIIPIRAAADSQIAKAAERRLRESPYFFLRHLNCLCQEGQLTLRGQVPFGQLRDIAETIAYRVDGVIDVYNEVEVLDPMGAPRALKQPVRVDRRERNAG